MTDQPDASILSVKPIPIAELPAAFRVKYISTAGAGFPSPAQDYSETAIDLVDLLQLDRAASFVFRVAGNSMNDAGINDKDIVVVDRDRRPQNGCVVIAIVEGGFVIRQLIIRDGTPYLEARNVQMSYPMTIADADAGVEIWGVVRASVRNLIV